MQLFDWTQPQGATGLSKSLKGVSFQVQQIKVGNLGVVQKTRIEGDHQTMSFGFMQLLNIMHPRGSAGLSNFS